MDMDYIIMKMEIILQDFGSNGKNADEKITIDNRTYRRKDISDGSILAGLYKSSGKLQSRSKALNQKNAEQQSKSGK